MRGVRDQNLPARAVTTLGVIGAYHQQAGEFTMSAGRRLQRDGMKAANLGKTVLKIVHQGEIALNCR